MRFLTPSLLSSFAHHSAASRTCAAQGIALFLVTVIQTGCATTEQSAPSPALQSQASQATYQLTEADKQLDCATIRGRIKIAVLRLRAQRSYDSGSVLARTMHKSVGQMFGDPARSAEPDQIAQMEQARVEAYTNLLREKSCSTIGLDEAFGEAA